MLNLEYLIEFYIGQALTEKAMNSYHRYLNDSHTKIIEELIQNPENLRTIIVSVTQRNCTFVNFMLECLYVIEANITLSKNMLETFRKCNMDTFIISCLSKTDIKVHKTDQEVSFVINECPQRIKCLNLLLHLFHLMLNKNNPILLDFFFTENGNKKYSLKLTTTLIQLLCQKNEKLISMSVENIFDSLLRVWEDTKNFSNYSSEVIEREKILFLTMIIRICRSLQIDKSVLFFKVINIFVINRKKKFAAFIDREFDTVRLFRDNLKKWKFSKTTICVLFSFLELMIRDEFMQSQRGHDVLVLVSHFKKELETQKRNNNVIYSKILAFEKKFVESFNSCMLIEKD